MRVDKGILFDASEEVYEKEGLRVYYFKDFAVFFSNEPKESSMVISVVHANVLTSDDDWQILKG